MITNTVSRWHNLFKRFRADQNGAIAIMFGLMVMILLAASAIALDSSRVQRLRTLTMSALDAASLATAKELTLNGPGSGNLQQLARSYFDANLRGQNLGEGTFEDFTVQVDPETGAVDISVNFLLKTAIGRVFNVSAFKETLSTRSVYSARDIELGLMLDVSGSMGGSRIASLKDASKDLIDIVLDNTNGDTRNRIGLAPYSYSVNAGSYADAATNGSASGTCVTERRGSEAFTDAPPSVEPIRSKTTRCPTATVFPLSDDKSELRTRINNLSAGGNTAGHLGIAWAWYLVSPEWASFWPSNSAPAEFDPRKVLKAVVIMTDGSFNTYYEGSNGNSKYQGTRLCENIKAKGITVFSVGLNAPSDALDLLRQCATSADYYFDTQTGEELREAFKRIAKELTALRLTG